MNMPPSRIIRSLRPAILVAKLLGLSVAVVAQMNLAILVVRGAVELPLSLTLSNLQEMPQGKVRAREKDSSEVAFEGFRFFEVVRRAKPRLSELCCSNEINRVVVITAADGYQALLSLPELDPRFTSREIALIYRRQGEPLGPRQGPLEIVAPDDKIHARWVHQVTRIDVLPLGDLGAASTKSWLPQAKARS